MLRRRAAAAAAQLAHCGRPLHASAAAAAKAPAAGAKKAKKGAPVDAGPGVMDCTRATGVNVLKGGSDPELGPDDAYPPWLFALAAPLPSAAALRKRMKDEELGVDEARARLAPGSNVMRCGGCRC